MFRSLTTTVAVLAALALLVPVACDSDSGSEEIILEGAWAAVPPTPLVGDAAACPAGFDSAPGAGQHEGFAAADQQRSFFLALPDEATFKGAYPLMVLFNGTGGSGQEAFDTYQAQSFVDAGFIVLAPDSINNGTVWPVWDAMRQASELSLPNKDLEYFDSLIACMATHYDIDEFRIYVAGHSAGGMMVNATLQRRSELLAGGIVASGVLDLTSPDPLPALQAMTILVTWGGTNDAYSGEASGTDVEVPELNFVEQAALSSQFWEDVEGGHQVYCYGDEVGHEWLDGLAPWMAEYLLAHPKSLAQGDLWTLEQPAEDLAITCSEDAAQWVPPIQIECGTSDTVGCHEYCQFLADCAAENGTLNSVLGPQIEALGFAGEDYTDCSGCLTLCEADAAEGGAPDETVLGCISTAAETVTCGAGIPMEFIGGMDACCTDATDSVLCATFCGTINENSVAVPFFPGCAAWAPTE